jgi:hypothetical protein
MSEDEAFGEKLMGMQGFDAARAQRYRAEMEQLLVHRISRKERWGLGLGAIWIGGMLIGGGVAMASIPMRPERAGADEARWTVAIACMVTGLLMGGWMLRVAIQGGYARRVGDVMGPAIALVFCGGWGAAFVEMAWETADVVLRMKLLCMGGLIFVLLAGCFLVALLQWMHRQTQEKLLRVEYHLAELMERAARSA